MPLRLQTGWSKKIGRPNYGSLGATCSVDIELDAAMLQHNPEGFQDQVQQAFQACRQAVEDELASHLETDAAASRQNKQTAPADNAQGSTCATSSNGSGGSSRQATDRQLDYARQLADQMRGGGVRRLEALAQRMFKKPLAALTSLEASGLIDTLKAIRSKQIDAESAVGENGAAA